MPAKKPTITDVGRGKRIKELRILAGFTSQDALAKEVGVSRPAITQAENGEAFKIDTAIKIAKALKVDLDTLLLGSVRNTNTPVEAEPKGIPFYDIYAAAGPITMYSDLREYITDYIHVPGIDFNDCDFCVTVWEDSMKGKFNPGDVIICREVHDRTLLKPGASYFIITSEYKTVKDVYPGEEAENVKLVPYNKEQSPFDIALDKIIKIYHVRGRASINRIDN